MPTKFGVIFMLANTGMPSLAAYHLPSLFTVKNSLPVRDMYSHTLRYVVVFSYSLLIDKQSLLLVMNQLTGTSNVTSFKEIILRWSLP